MMWFKLPWPPSANTLYATVKGRRVLSRRGRDYKKNIRHHVNYRGEPLTSRLAAYLFLIEPDKRRRDIANVEKIVIDGLQEAGVMHDDSQIDMLHLERYGVDKINPHVLAYLQEIRSQEHTETRHD